MSEAKKEKKIIELVFPETGLAEAAAEKDKWIRKGPMGGKLLNQFVANIDDIVGWFKQYQVESIELWISGGIETEGVIKLAVSAKGEGGLKLTLRPKQVLPQA